MRKSLTVGSLVEAIERVIAILEAPRKGLKHLRHAKHVAPARAKVAEVLRGYFRRQEAAILRDVEPRLPHLLASFPHVQEASTPGNRFASSVMPSSLAPLRFAVTPGETSAYDAAMTDAILGAAKTIAKDLQIGLIKSDDFAAKYLRENSLSKLTGNLAAETTQRLRDSIAKAWDAGGSKEQVVDAIKGTFDDFSETRAATIARTETADAYNQARVDIGKDAGFNEKSWETESGDPCPICEANEAQGYIDIDDDFDSGDSEPTAHPNCLCVVNFRKSSGSEEE